MCNVCSLVDVPEELVTYPKHMSQKLELPKPLLDFSCSILKVEIQLVFERLWGLMGSIR